MISTARVPGDMLSQGRQLAIGRATPKVRRPVGRSYSRLQYVSMGGAKSGAQYSGSGG